MRSTAFVFGKIVSEMYSNNLRRLSMSEAVAAQSELLEGEIVTEKYRLPSEQVLEFYKAFKEPNPGVGPASLDESVIPHHRLVLKMKLIAEEFAELVGAAYGASAEEAVKAGFANAELLDDGTRDIVELSDAIGDLHVVIEGLAIEARIPTDAVLAEVHLSNMSKLDENGEPIRSDGVTPAVHDGEVKPLGKLLKGPNYFEPDLKAILAGKTPDRTPKLIKDAA
jgi:predicted HAD superfamily Cof-like phosphohydrolase